MADKKSRMDRMYGDSPTIGKDEDGKPKVIRPEKKSAEVSSGTEGVVKENPGMKDMMDKHAMERLDLHQKHEKEYMGLAQKYAKTVDGDSGADKIQKIEKDKKES